MEEESDEELEELNMFFEPRKNISSSGNEAVKPHVIEDYNADIGFVGKSDRMVNIFAIAPRAWKWTKKLFFHILDMAILNAYLLHKSRDGKMTQKIPRNVRELIAQSHEENITVSGVSLGEAKLIWGPTEPTRGETFATLAI
jgi:hypothetical protein